MYNKILVVEDDESINDILVNSLKVEGYVVRSAFNGKEARELISGNSISINGNIVTDENMIINIDINIHLIY